MTGFKEILLAPPEELVKILYKFNREEKPGQLVPIAKELKLKSGQLITAVGFNKNISELPDILPILGYQNLDDLTQERNNLFISDIYKKLSLENILAIYGAVKSNENLLQVMQYLLHSRLEKIESRIEETVNSIIIEKYKAEIRAVYSDNIAGLDFAEERLNKMDSGFRALVNEVSIIAEHRIIPAGDIFFRDTILPQEKRKLLEKELVPVDLIHTRLQDETISQEERKMLLEFKQLNRLDDSGN